MSFHSLEKIGANVLRPNIMVHLGLSPVRVTRFLAFCVCFVDRCLPFCPFPLVIVLFVLRFTDSDIPFGFFKLFFAKMGGVKSSNTPLIWSTEL
jgi:hypothetical protein